MAEKSASELYRPAGLQMVKILALLSRYFMILWIYILGIMWINFYNRFTKKYSFYYVAELLRQQYIIWYVNIMRHFWQDSYFLCSILVNTVFLIPYGMFQCLLHVSYHVACLVYWYSFITWYIETTLKNTLDVYIWCFFL